MKISERTLRISAASFLALFMMGGSYLLSGPNFLTDRIANAGSTEELLKAYASKDSDGDSLPDWQEALYGTDPRKAISNSFGIPDGQAAREGKLTPATLASQLPGDPTGEETPEDLLNDIPGVDPAPGSITEQFSRDFFRRYVEASGGQPLSEEAQQKIISELLATYSVQVAGQVTSKYTSISTRPDATVSVAAYTAAVEDIFSRNIPTQDYDVIILLQALIQRDETAALPKLQKLEGVYKNITRELLATPVPPSLISSHVTLIQGVDEVARAISVTVEYQTDPIATLGAIPTFVSSREKIVNSFKGIVSAFIITGTPAPGTPGAELVEFVRNEEAR